MDEHRHHGGFFNGFILGLLVGAGLVFLFGTNKGRRVLQLLLDQIEENTELSELLEMPEGEDDEYMMGVEEQPQTEEKEVRVSDTGEVKSQPTVAKVKRFFKSAPKKLVS